MLTLHTAQLTGYKFAGCWDVDSFKTRNSWQTCFALKYLRQPPAFWAPDPLGPLYCRVCSGSSYAPCKVLLPTSRDSSIT